MSGGSRPLPIRPSLRYLKLEAKRRLAAGEFSSLDGAQQAIAWEYGLPSWTALEQLISGEAQQESHALPQLRWVIARFRDAGAPAWSPPGDDELRQHFDDRFLAEAPAGELIAAITSVAANLREEPVIIGHAPLQARIQIAALDVFAWVEAEPPHRLTGPAGVSRRRAGHRHPRGGTAARPHTWRSSRLSGGDGGRRLRRAGPGRPGSRRQRPGYTGVGGREGLGGPWPARGPRPAGGR